MAPQPFRLSLARSRVRPLIVTLSFINVVLAMTTGLFIHFWGRMDELEEPARFLTRYWLIQGHLGTENVLAVWYSSMLLLAVGVAGFGAFALADRRDGWLRHGWLLFAAVFLLLSLDELGSFHERVGMLPYMPGAGGVAVGWIYVLAVPITAVGLFMLVFAWRYLRRVPGTFRLVALGVGFFLLNPVVERVEMAMIHGKGAAAETWQRLLHDVLQVLEEGGLELFGILCFLGAVLNWIRATSGESLSWVVDHRHLRWFTRAGTAALAGGALVSGWIVNRLPEGDTGIAENWFAAVAWAAAGALLAARAELIGWVRIVTLGTALMVSAAFGAALYYYVDWLDSSTRWHIPVAGIIAAGLALELAFRGYLFRRSPMSSTASPTLRRPRPNPS